LEVRSNLTCLSLDGTPGKGQASQALLALLGQALAVPKNDLDLVRGYASGHKIMATQSLSPEEPKERLAQALSRKELFQT